MAMLRTLILSVVLLSPWGVVAEETSLARQALESCSSGDCGDSSADLALLQLAGLRTEPAEKLISILYFEASDCSGTPKDVDEFSIDPNRCVLNWNYTCGCSKDGAPLFVATFVTPWCADQQAYEVSKLPFGQCTGGKDFLQPGSFMRIDDDSGHCTCPLKECTVEGDPHVKVFDAEHSVAFLKMNEAADNDEFGWGDYWLVKSNQVWVQARYRKVYYPKANQPLSHTYLTALAVGGPFLKGNSMVIEPREGAVTWITDDGKVEEILKEAQEVFEISGLVKAVYKVDVHSVKDPSERTLGIEVEMPNNVKMTVNRFGKHIDVSLKMHAAAGGDAIDGQCGNFNGVAADDTATLIDTRIGFQIPEDEKLFVSGQ